MNDTNIPQSVDSDFSAVNNFVIEEQRRAKQIRRYRSSQILKSNLIYIALFLISLGLLVFLLSLAYWFYYEKPSQIIKVDGNQTYNTTNYNLREDINKLEQIIKDQKKFNQQKQINPNQVTEEFIVFQGKDFLLSSGFNTVVQTGYKFTPDKIDYPYSQFCYMYKKGRVRIDLMYKNGKSQAYSAINYKEISTTDFNKAKSYCNFRD
jgi:hypothetical protein